MNYLEWANVLSKAVLQLKSFGYSAGWIGEKARLDGEDSTRVTPN